MKKQNKKSMKVLSNKEAQKIKGRGFSYTGQADSEDPNAGKEDFFWRRLWH